MKIKKDRIEWIDICKTIGIIWVIMGHVIVPKSLDVWIHSFHMPLFFILSGLCFNEIKHTKISEFFVSRFKTLIIPYIIFSIILYYVWIMVLQISNYEPIRNFNNLMTCMIKPATTTSCYGAVNWFLPSLFIVEIVFFIICKVSKKSKKIIGVVLFLIFIVAYLYPKFISYRIPFAIDSSIMGLFFYGLGWLFKSIPFDKIKIIIRKNLCLSLFIIILAFILINPLIIINKMTNMRNLVFGNYSLFLINSVSVSLLFIFLSIYIDILSNKVKMFNVMKIIGNHTLVILLFNPIFARLYLLLTNNNEMIKNTYLLVFNNIIVSIIILIICVLISIFINKFMPFLLGKKKKKNYFIY